MSRHIGNVIYKPKLREALNILNPLSHRVKLHILQYIDDQDQASLVGICQRFHMIQPEASHQISVLKSIGAVTTYKRGRHTYVENNYQNLEKIQNALKHLK